MRVMVRIVVVSLDEMVVCDLLRLGGGVRRV